MLLHHYIIILETLIEITRLDNKAIESEKQQRGKRNEIIKSESATGKPNPLRLDF